jgi:hypothetical protein
MPFLYRPIALSCPSPRHGSLAIAWPGLLAMAYAIGLFGADHADARGYATRDVGNWTVAAGKDGKGCFLTKEYERAGRTTLLLGLDTDGANHLSVLNANWSIKPKEPLKLDFQLSAGGYSKHFAVGMASEGKQGFVTNFEWRFPAYFAASKDLRISRGSTPVERLSLEGSGAAVAELRRCVEDQRAESATAASEKDEPDDIPKDPFAPVAERKSKRK